MQASNGTLRLSPATAADMGLVNSLFSVESIVVATRGRARSAFVYGWVELGVEQRVPK